MIKRYTLPTKSDSFILVGFIWANESPSKATGLSRGSFGWVAQDRQNANTLLAVVLL